MRIAVGMSGGVDSSIAALLLQQQGHDVLAVFMKNWREQDSVDGCTAAQDLYDAQAVCEKLGVTLHTVSFADEYWDHVFEHFLAEYQVGRTPNPDVICNREIKFKAFLNYAVTLDADMIATGHYAGKDQKNNQYRLLKGADANKDQSYFLHALGQQQLAKSLFPLSHLHKTEVRAMAAKHGLVTHAKKDSTGICFIGERKFKDFLQHYLPAQPGNIIDDVGNVVGTHDGLMYHTIGQRQGLRIGGSKQGNNDAWYVVDKKLADNELVVVQGKNHALLFKSELQARQLTWVAGQPPGTTFDCTAKIRYRQTDQICHAHLTATDDTAHITFTTPQRAVAPGQSIVFYDGIVCLGGGIIEQ